MGGNDNIFFHVSNVDMVVKQDKSLPSPTFEIEVKATFVIVERDCGVGGEVFMEVGRITSEVVHEFPLEDLISDSNGAVLDMLDSMRVPVQPSMVEEIAAIAVRWAAAARESDRKVLRMRVEIEAVVDHVPDFGNDDTDDDNEDEAAMTMEEVAENVGKVVVEGSEKDCPVCLEELVVGSEAACMPCSHVFHDLCIVTWLKKTKRCPCCRFMLSKEN
ncbi:uncharacterized protein LOC111298594 [Durio zibethinus]|uniref:RING-type E3 ubiquitin transferase n=1 Tax=Durio zibethinus TaxID=66656 RepID=A0A6P5Z9F5_DURZI|nr:uncharacterized protein LOC111298594 [Durio zibethinus]